MTITAKCATSGCAWDNLRRFEFPGRDTRAQNLGLILIGLGGFLLVLGLLATLWAPGQVKRAPIDTDSITRLSGHGRSDPDRGHERRRARDQQHEVRQEQVGRRRRRLRELHLPGARRPGTRTAASRAPATNADPNVISVGQPDIFATDRGDRHGGQRQQVPARRARRRPRAWSTSSGSTREKTDYPFWDGVLNDTVTATYEATETVDGLETYRFHYVVDRRRTPRSPPASRAPTAWTRPCGSSPRPGRSSTRSSTTCARSTARRCSTCSCRSPTTRSSTNAEDAKSNVSSLDLLTDTVPLIGFIGGAAADPARRVALVLSRRSQRPARAATPRTLRGLGLARRRLTCTEATTHGRRPAGVAPSCMFRSTWRGEGSAREQSAAKIAVPGRVAARGCPTSRPRPGRGPRATPARAGR